MAVQEDAAHLPELAGLLAVESDGLDPPLHIPDVRAGEGPRGRVPREELAGGDLRHLVPCPLREDRPDEDLERVLRLRGDLREGGASRRERVRPEVPPPEAREDELNLAGPGDGQGPPPPCRSIP